MPSLSYWCTSLPLESAAHVPFTPNGNRMYGHMSSNAHTPALALVSALPIASRSSALLISGDTPADSKMSWR